MEGLLGRLPVLASDDDGVEDKDLGDVVDAVYLVCVCYQFDLFAQDISSNGHVWAVLTIIELADVSLRCLQVIVAEFYDFLNSLVTSLVDITDHESNLVDFHEGTDNSVFHALD